MDKHTLRLKMKERLQSLDKITYEYWSYEIAQQLYKTDEWKKAQIIGLTMSIFPEVDTWQLIRKGWEQQKTIVIPRCNPKMKEMTFHTLTSFQELETVYYGLFEPKEETTQVSSEQIELLIVPGLIFNSSGYRIGFGGGYYDRYLQTFHGSTLSLAFSPQIVEHRLIEPHDLPVDYIMTENEMIDCQNNDFSDE